LSRIDGFNMILWISWDSSLLYWTALWAEAGNSQMTGLMQAPSSQRNARPMVTFPAVRHHCPFASNIIQHSCPNTWRRHLP